MTPPWIEALYNSRDEVKRSGLSGLFDAIQEVTDDELNHALEVADVERMCVLSIIALLRYTGSRQRYLPAYEGLRDRSNRELVKRGEDASKLLMGLIPDKPGYIAPEMSEAARHKITAAARMLVRRADFLLNITESAPLISPD